MKLSKSSLDPRGGDGRGAAQPGSPKKSSNYRTHCLLSFPTRREVFRAALVCGEGDGEDVFFPLELRLGKGGITGAERRVGGNGGDVGGLVCAGAVEPGGCPAPSEVGGGRAPPSEGLNHGLLRAREHQVTPSAWAPTVPGCEPTDVRVEDGSFACACEQRRQTSRSPAERWGHAMRSPTRRVLSNRWIGGGHTQMDDWVGSPLVGRTRPLRLGVSEQSSSCPCVSRRRKGPAAAERNDGAGYQGATQAGRTV